jgi:hypothetical protein
LPPPGTPVRSTYATDGAPAEYIERVDSSSTEYQKYPRGTLYSTLPNADQRIIDAYPDLFLLRETNEPTQYPFTFRVWSTQPRLVTQKIGQENLTPAKYRRLVRNIETNELVSADYQFPVNLSGDQTEVELQQQTIEEARLKTIEEIINVGGDALLGGEVGEYGQLAIYESVVPEGTPVDEGFFVVRSTVTPFGNGKAVKITAKYAQFYQVATIKITSGGSGYTTPPTVTITGGGGTGATAVAVVEGDQVSRVDVTNPGSNYTSIPTVAFSSGAATAVAIMTIARLLGQDYDEVLDVGIPYFQADVAAGTTGLNRSDVRPIDYLRSRIKSIDITAAKTVLDNYLLSFPSTTNIDAPDILNDILIGFEDSVGAGSSTDEITTYGWSGNHSFTFPSRATAQGSSGLTGDVIPMITPFYGIKRHVTNYLFFMPAPVTSDQIVARLEALTGLTVTDWSDFHPTNITVTLISTKLSARVEAGFTTHHSVSDSGNADVESTSTGTSKEVTVVIKTVRIPPTVHGDVIPKKLEDNTSLFSGSHIDGMDLTYDSAGATVEAHAAGAGPHADASVNIVGTMRVIARGLSATSGPTSLPDTGLLIVNTNAAPYKYGYVRIHAEVIDASTL